MIAMPMCARCGRLCQFMEQIESPDRSVIRFRVQCHGEVWDRPVSVLEVSQLSLKPRHGETPEGAQIRAMGELVPDTLFTEKDEPEPCRSAT